MKLLKDMAAAALVTVLFLLLVEGLLRVSGTRYQASFYMPDQQLGYALRPNSHGWNVLENTNYFQVNADGMADRPHTVQRPPDVIRIAVVGDSVSEAKQVPRNQAYWAVMERVMNARLKPTGRRVEVLNFGVAGYSLAQDALVIASSRLWKYDPQIVLLAGTVESLVLRSSRKLAPNLASEHVPFYIRRGAVLTPDAETLRERAAFSRGGLVTQRFGDVMNASRLLTLFNEGVKKSAEELKLRLGRQTHGNAYKESDSFLGPANSDLAAAWDVSQALILLSKQEAARHHAELWLFTLDMPQQVDPDPSARTAFMRSLGIGDLFISDHLFAEFAARQGIPHGELAPPLLALAEQQKIALHGFAGTPRNSGHWNEAGHRAAGELLARQLLSASPLFYGARSALEGARAGQ
jgi:hypothetical protein